jgi:hypothetical protein
LWPALLAALASAVGSNVKKVAVIYDQNQLRPAGDYQKKMIADVFGTYGFAPLNPVTMIRADAPTNQATTNPNISNDITAFLRDVGSNPAGLIVTAGTRTTMLREQIVAAVATRNANAPPGNKLFAIYPSRIFLDVPLGALPSGALLAYGPDLRKLYKDIANFYVKPIIASGTVGRLDTNKDYKLTISKKGAGDVNYGIPPRRRRSRSSSPTDRVEPLTSSSSTEI